MRTREQIYNDMRMQIAAFLRTHYGEQLFPYAIERPLRAGCDALYELGREHPKGPWDDEVTPTVSSTQVKKVRG